MTGSLDIKAFIRSVLIAFSFVVGLELSLRPSLGVHLTLVLIPMLCLTTCGSEISKRRKEFLFFVGYPFVTWVLLDFVTFMKGDFESFNVATLFTLTYASLTSFLLLYSNLKVWILKISQYIIILFFALQCVREGALDPEIFVYSSRAFIATILLSISASIQFLDYQKCHKVDLLPPLLIVYVSFYSWSRTGIICSVIYAVIILFTCIYRIPRKSMRLSLGVLFVALACWFVANNLEIIEEIDVYSKFEEKGMDLANRDNLWKSYFKGFGLEEFMLGGKITIVESGVENAHNSLIQLHGQLGLVGMCMILFILGRWYNCLKNNLFLFFILTTLLALCAFNFVFFFTIYDFAIYLFIFSKRRALDRGDFQEIAISII